VLLGDCGSVSCLSNRTVLPHRGVLINAYQLRIDLVVLVIYCYKMKFPKLAG
jgi:hypothetical protein